MICSWCGLHGQPAGLLTPDICWPCKHGVPSGPDFAPGEVGYLIHTPDYHPAGPFRSLAQAEYLAELWRGRAEEVEVVGKKGRDMDINKAFPGQFLRSEDLGTNRPVVTIDRVELEKIGDEHKPILYFQGKERGLVLNKTNSAMIQELLGSPETEEWSGQRVRLYVTKVDFQGKRVSAIRIESAPRGASAPPPKPEPEPDFVASDSDVPF